MLPRIMRAFPFYVVAASMLATTHASFIETYDDGTDVGLWHCSLGVPRILEPSGREPGSLYSAGRFQHRRADMGEHLDAFSTRS